ncbi:S41 family peptidase [Mucilaginibacter lacusdianchii]|uniref:S41 family peptidase n=1 Tax=Mucilaginibacter lacusdianchii TaxID=2684211 RepID=UPI00131D7521|nr:S41 family peptidase [Mucilaginibacter sp. JXJ CY 39]
MKRISVVLLLILANQVMGQVFDTVSYYKKYTPKQLHHDLDFLLKKFEDVHPNYFSETPQDTVFKRYEQLKTRITNSMTRIDFMNLFAPVAFGVIKDGHNFVNLPPEDLKAYINKGGKFFPLPVTIRGGKLFVNSIHAKIPYQAEILTINGKPVTEIVQAILSTYNPEDRDYEERFLSNYFNVNYWQVFGGADYFHLTYSESLSKFVKRIDLQPKSELDIMKLRSQSFGGKLSYVFEYPNYAYYEMPGLETGVIEYKACDDLENFRPFCDSVFTRLQNKHYKNLIIDIRSNLGGTTRLNGILMEYLTDKPITQYAEIDTKVSKDGKKDFISANRKYAHWFKWFHYLYYPIYIRTNRTRREALTAKNGTFIRQMFLPEKPIESMLRFKGNIYLLTSKATYSSAAIFAAAFKCYHLGTVIGQETGEPTCFTGDWVAITLPNTKLQLGISNKRFILACGKCDGHGVVPDILIDDKHLATRGGGLNYHTIELVLKK